jgi:hypothetical protein
MTPSRSAAPDVITGNDLQGTTYWRLQCPIGSPGGSINNFATDEPAREPVTRIARTAAVRIGKADKELARRIAERGH